MKKKLRLTRSLIKLALNDGWTQKQIASTCRTQQSIVSAWACGEKLATEVQVLPLLKIYGNKIRRLSFKVYHSYNYESKEHIYSKVEGTIIFSYTITKENQESRKVINVPVFKLMIHDQGNGKFCTVVQHRPEINNNRGQKEYLECSHEAGIWFSTIFNKQDTNDVIKKFEDLSEQLQSGYSHESLTLPFLVRKALIENGHSIDSIVEYSATW